MSSSLPPQEPNPTSSPFDADSPERRSVQWNDSLSRRRFLASTGKAGAVTLLGFHSLKVEVLAESASGSAIF